MDARWEHSSMRQHDLSPCLSRGSDQARFTSKRCDPHPFALHAAIVPPSALPICSVWARFLQNQYLFVQQGPSFFLLGGCTFCLFTFDQIDERER